MNKQKFIAKQRKRRSNHVRRKVRGNAERPRLSIFRSNNNIYCQIVDDEAGRTIVSASSRDKDLREDATAGNCEAAAKIGKAIAEKALAAGLKQVCFDRGHFRYNGRVAALATAARESGLDF